MTRVVVIGVDGGSEAVIQAAGSSLPNLTALRTSGTSCTLRSTVPPITAAAWPSMFTGWNPGRHGMFDFRPLDIAQRPGIFGPGDPEGFDGTSRFTGSASWRGHAVWDVAGVRSAVSGVPMTYPPWPIDGRMTAGFPLPDYTRNHSSPTADGSGPALLLDADRLAAMTDAHLARHCLELIRRQAEAVRRDLRDDGTVLVVAVFQATDFAQHRLWKYLERPGHPLREALLDMYRVIDGVVGDARAAVGVDGAVVVASDHGFGPHPRTLVSTDSVLAGAGLLTPRRPHRASLSPASLRRSPRMRELVRSAATRIPWAATGLARVHAAVEGIDLATTAAYRYPLYGPAEGVVVNLRGRTSNGVVAPGAEYEGVRDRAIEALTALIDAEGRRPVEWVRRREEVFDGPCTALAPDVVALFAQDYKPVSGLGPTFQAAPARLRSRYSGVHTKDGIFAAAGSGIPAGVRLESRELVDVAPTILGLLGHGPVEPCDGRDLFSRDQRILAPARAPRRDAGEAVDAALSEAEERTIERSLRGLGYIE